MNQYLKLFSEFIRKHSLLIFSIKVLKIAILVFFISCSGNTESSKTPDTIKVDLEDTDLPGDTLYYKGDDEEGDEDDDINPISPQES